MTMQPNEVWIAPAIPKQKPDSLGRRTWHTAWLDSTGRLRGQVSFCTMDSMFNPERWHEGTTFQRVSLADMAPLFEAAKAALLQDTHDKQGHEYVVTGDYRYRIKTMGGSSQRYGDCEVCHKPVDVVFYQVEQKRFDNDGETGWTEYECHSLFGHPACLHQERRV